MGRKSTAQPRPVLHVPPRGIGPIVDPNENDVLCGRGGRINSHAGNVQFRDVIAANKKEYLAPATKKLEKAHIAARIVNDIRSMDPSGRFLKEDRGTGLWFDIGDAKAIKKTGQALREDAPDIRTELGGDSSGDEKHSSDEGKKSPSKGKPEASPKSDKAKQESKQSPKVKNTSAADTTRMNAQSRQQGMVSGRGPQHSIPTQPGGWPQGNGAMTPQEYQAQVAMPPPYTQQMNNPYMEQVQQIPVQMQMQNQGSFEPRNIPIQNPTAIPPAVYSMPNQLMSSARSVGNRMTSVSRQAMEILSQSGNPNPNQQRLPEDIAFGRQFHPPASGTVLSSDNTMSTVSGLSNPLSSGIGLEAGSGLMSVRGSGMNSLMSARGSSLMGSSMEGTRASNLSGARGESLRMSQLDPPRFRGSSRSQFMEAMRGGDSSRMSDLSMGSMTMTRAFSFPDMSASVDNEAWQAIIMEGDEDRLQEPQPQSVLSGASSGRFSTGSGRVLGGRASSAMSVSMMSLGSTASSTQWLAAMRDSAMDDGQSILSGMSSDLNALDLAAGLPRY
jgi:hypothetical protein